MSLRIMQMIEHVRTYGVLTAKTGKKPDAVLKQKFFDTVVDNNIFIFSPTDLKDVDVVNLTLKSSDLEVSDSPFDVISIEVSGSDSFVVYSGEEAAGGYLKKLKISCVMYNDIENDIFVFYDYLVEDSKTDWDRLVTYCSPESDSPFYYEMAALVGLYTKKLNVEKVGLENVNEKFKIRKSNGESKYHKISQVVHVAPSKTYFKKINEGEHRTIDYSHRFFRRGHWRKTEPLVLGKDRHGTRSQYGRTWVTESIIGDESLPLINKIRKVEQ